MGFAMRLAVDGAWDRIVPAFVLPYAAWTLYVHGIVAARASFQALLLGLPLLLLVATVATWGWFLLRDPADAGGPVAPAPTATAPARPDHPWPLAPFTLAVGWVGLLMAGMPYAVFWWSGLLALGFAWAWQLRAAPAPPIAPVTAPHAAWIVGGVAIAAIAVVLFAHRPDIDDAFHLSVPATLLRFPGRAVLLNDTMYRLADAPILMPFYRLNNYDVLVAVIARASGIDHLTVAYLVLPTLFAALSVLAWSFLLRQLVPSRWLVLLPVLFACVMALGEAHRAYGNFAFVRLFQGKAVLATCMVPVITAAALAYARHGGLKHWLLLFASQVAALGFAASALFVAPAAAALGLAGGWSPDRVRSRRFVPGLLASTYILGAGWLVASGARGARVISVSSSVPMPSVPALLESTWGTWTAPVLLVALLSAWAFARDPVRGRYFSAGAFCFLLVALNPYTVPFAGEHSIAVKTYWRLAWALPLPLFLAVVIDGLFVRALALKPRLLAASASLLLGVLAVLFATRHGTLRDANQVTLGMPGADVSPVEFAVARRIVEHAGEQGAALAPEAVAAWLPVFVRHPRLVGVRQAYLSLAFDPAETAQRSNMMRYVTGEYRPPDAPAWFAHQLRRHGVTVVAFPHAGRWSVEIESLLAGAGWRVLACDRYVIMVGGASAAAPRDRPPGERCVLH